jgi:tryptophanyl-tRNA synthetase
MYPVLMAADILAFDANQVPVGRDQVQHIEMARDIAQRFNHVYGGDWFVLPEAVVEEQVATLPGLDGRKMSKSYDNTIPLFEGGPQRLREAIMRIVTDSRAPGEPKDTEDSALFTIYQAFAGADETAAFRAALHGGMAWGDAKQALFERIEDELGPLRERYDALMARPDAIEEVLQAGAAKARAVATPFLQRLREAVGLGHGATAAAVATPVKRKGGKLARFVSFRDADGSFRFRLLAADGEQLLTSRGFADPKAAGACMRRLQQAGAALDIEPRDDGFAIMLDGEPVAEGAGIARLRDELAALATAGAD